MALYRLSQRFRRRFKPKDAVDGSQDKDAIEIKVLLLDDSDLTFYIKKKSKGQVLLDLIFKNLDLVEKDYFGLQFMDTHQVSHWLDPTKKIKKQVKIGPPYTLHFRVKFYAADPQDLGEELTRLEVPQKMAIELVAYSLQSQLGDYEQDLHGDDYMQELKFYPYQNKELEKEILKKHKSLIGLNPAECEVNFLRLIKKLDFYGINLHKVQEQGGHETYHYLLTTAQAAKHLWKCAIEHHTFFRMVKTSARPKRSSSFIRFGSRFRYSGRTEYQTQRDARMSSRKSMKFKRASSERFSKRTTVGFIRVGSRVWGKALNGDYYKGLVTGLGQMIHVKFDNGDTIAHDRDDTECVVFDVDPDPKEIQIGTRVIAHWPTLPAYLAGNVIGMEHRKYYVQYDDGDKHHNEINQMRLLKPPVYFGPGSDIRKVKLKKKSESMKVTSLTGKAVITTELPRKVSSQQLTDTEGGDGVLRSKSLPTTIRPSNTGSIPANGYSVDTEQVCRRQGSLPDVRDVPSEEAPDNTKGQGDVGPKKKSVDSLKVSNNNPQSRKPALLVTDL